MLAIERPGEWVELPANEECRHCWRRYAGPRVRAHIIVARDGGYEWCASRTKEIPLRWFRSDSLDAAKRQAEEFCARIPEIGPMQDVSF